MTHCEKCGWKWPASSSNRPAPAPGVACPNPACDGTRKADQAHGEEPAPAGEEGRKRRPHSYPPRKVHEHRHNGQPRGRRRLDDMAKAKAELRKAVDELMEFDPIRAWLRQHFSPQFLDRASSLGRVRSLRKRNDPVQIAAFRVAIKRGYLTLDDGTLKRYDRHYLHTIGVL